MENYVSVGNIIEQERLRRQAQIAKGIESEVLDHIEKAHNDEFYKAGENHDSNLDKFANDVDSLNKAETEFLLSKIQRQINADPESQLLKSFRSIAIAHVGDIEKGVYADNALNRKLGRVGQTYGGKKKDDEHESEWSGLSRKKKKEEKNKYVDDYQKQIMSRYDVDEKTAKKNAIKLTELVGKMDAGTLDFGEGNKQMKVIWDSMEDKKKKKKGESELDKLKKMSRSQVISKFLTDEEDADYNEAIQHSPKDARKLEKIAMQRYEKLIAEKSKGEK